MSSSSRRIPDPLLERYLADALDAEARAQLEATLANSAEDRARLDELRADSARLLSQYPPEPMFQRLLQLGTQREPLPQGATKPPQSMGGYELLERLSGQSMDAVYRARDRQGQTVALKMPAGGALAAEDERSRFLRAARAAARLDHPHIVPIHEVSEHEGCPFFTMKLLEGGRLTERLDQFRGSPRRVAELVATLARAVHYGHQHNILHRDLKPDNVLFDAAGRPYIADFGVARILDPDAQLTQSGIVVGTPSYMPPEQAEGRSRHITPAADVYGLGTILYELLTGQPPFKAATPAEVMHQVIRKPPTPPRKVDPRIDEELERICLRCLEKEPARRFGSAEALAQELDRYLKGESLQTRQKRWGEQLWQWMLRHPAPAFRLGTVMWLLLVTTVATLFVAQAQLQDRAHEALNTNRTGARAIASTVLLQLREYSDVVGQASKDPRLPSLMRAGSQTELVEFCRTLHEAHTSPRGGPEAGAAPLFNYWFILDTQGTARGRWGLPSLEFLGKDYAWRDYFIGAARLAPQRSCPAYVSRAFKSESDGLYRFAVSAPIHDEQGTWLGVIVGMVDTGPTLGALRLNELSASQRTSMLVSLRDRERDEAEAGQSVPSDYMVLLRDGLKPGQTTLLNADTARQLEAVRAGRQPASCEQLRLLDPWPTVAIDQYRDPFAKVQGSWLAAFAPVGDTSMGVIVQMHQDDVSAPERTLARRLVLWGGLPFVLGTVLLGLVLRRFSHRATR